MCVFFHKKTTMTRKREFKCDQIMIILTSNSNKNENVVFNRFVKNDTILYLFEIKSDLIFQFHK